MRLSSSLKRTMVLCLLTGAVLLPASIASASAKTVIIKRGDTLGKLAAANHITVNHLKIANHLATNEIIVGQSLYIPAQSTQIYQIQSGDTLWILSNKFQTTIAKLKEINQLNTDELIDGDYLIVPQVIHTVKRGDVLWKIASKYGVTIEAIVQANKLSGYEINVGQKLVMPIASAEKAAPPKSEDTGAAPAPAESAPVKEDKPTVEMTAYTVKGADTPWSISIDKGIPMTEFLAVNHLSESDYIYDGQVVKIPVHHIPITKTQGEKYGEYLDWFEAAQYVFPIGKLATVTDFKTGTQFQVKRTIGAGHSDTEPYTAKDAAIIKDIWGGNYSWSVRPVIVEVDGRKIAASMTSMPHSIEFITDNDYNGHFDIHFLNSRRHKDDKIDPLHQAAIKIAAGVE